MRSLVIVCALLITACAGHSGTARSSGMSASEVSAAPSPAASASPEGCVRPAEEAGSARGDALQLGPLHFVDPRHGWIASGALGGFRALRTSDGGTNWSSVPVTGIGYAIALRFANECVGWLLTVADGASRVALYGTSDGGGSWHEQITRTNQGRLTGAASGISEVEVPDASHAFVAADVADCVAPCTSELLGSSDGGAQWERLHAFGGRVQTLRFSDAIHGWALTFDPTSRGGTPGLEATTDGGKTWSRRVLPPFADQIDFATASDGWALGRDGSWCTGSSCSHWYLYRTTDGGNAWTRLHDSDEPTKAAWWIPNPQASSAGFLQGPRFVDATHGWMVLGIGAGGAGQRVGGVITTADGGATWQQSGVEPFPKDPRGVWFVDVRHGWATSGSLVKRGPDELYRTNDGGRTWERQLP